MHASAHGEHAHAHINQPALRASFPAAWASVTVSGSSSAIAPGGLSGHVFKSVGREEGGAGVCIACTRKQ